MKKNLIIATVALSISLISSAAFANTYDVGVTVAGDTAGELGSVVSLDFTVDSLGTKKARSVKLYVDIPTAGTLAAIPSGCTVNNSNRMLCEFGSMNAGSSNTVSVDYALPNTASTLTFDAWVTTRSNDNNGANDSASHDVEVEDYAYAIQDGDVIDIAVCYGSIPLTWDDCTPGSLLYGQLGFNGDGSVVTYNPGYTGTWDQVTSYDITITIRDANDNSVVNIWTGAAVANQCFEGSNENPQSGYYGGWQGCF